MSIVKTGVFVIVAALLVYGGHWYNTKADMKVKEETIQRQQQDAVREKEVLSKLIKDEVEGAGAAVETGDTVTVHYVGSLDDGKIFDSSYDRSQPFTFIVGAGSVIEGWEKGLIGMKVGGRRNLTIPPDLGYGDQATQLIPANSTLHFTVDLVDVKKRG